MGTTFNYFKRYEIRPDEEDSFDHIIHYYGGGRIGFNYDTSAILGILFKCFGVLIPIYDRFEPPVTGTLQLVEPALIAETCEKALLLLEKHKNPIMPNKYVKGDSLPLYEYEELQHHSFDELSDSLKCRLEQLKNLSKSGFFLTEESD